MTSAIVIGGGISGIAAAIRLKEHGVDARIYEGDDSLGGRIGTRTHGSLEFDLGGRNFGAHDDDLLGLLAALGVHRLVDYRFNSVNVGPGHHFDMRSGGNGSTKLKRFVGNIAALGLKSPGGLVRLLGLRSGAGRESARFLGMPFWVDVARRTDDPLVSEYFGPAIGNEIIRPWTLRMMGAEPEEVYLGNLAPLLGAPSGSALKRVDGGMGVVMRAAEMKLDVRLNHRVTSILIENGRVSGVEVTHGDRVVRESADIVVTTMPATVAADIVEGASALAAALRRVAYHPVATIVAEYSDYAFPGDMTGFFIPRGHAVTHVAKYDDENRIRFSFAGVEARKAMVAESVERLLDLGESTFKHFGGRLHGRRAFVGRVWRPGLCAHSRMHHETVASIREQSDRIRGLVLTGDYFRGNMLGGCIRAAKENVDREIRARAS